MAKSRKDNKGRVLRKGETQRSCNGKYVYTYTDPEGKRRSIYSKDIIKLREREDRLIKDQLDGLDTYMAGSATVNFVFDRYISTKSELRGPTFQLAVRDDIIRNNPSDGVMAQIKKQPGRNHGVRHALTLEQQRAFINYIENNPTYYRWTSLFKFLLGTGCRIGGITGLRWGGY